MLVKLEIIFYLKMIKINILIYVHILLWFPNLHLVLILVIVIPNQFQNLERLYKQCEYFYTTTSYS